jgi:hypothetical protein
MTAHGMRYWQHTIKTQNQFQLSVPEQTKKKK